MIRQSALECFCQNGADRTTILEIAERARVRPSLIHYYYGSQDELYAEVFNLVLEHLREKVLAPLEGRLSAPHEAIIDYVHAHFDWARRYPQWYATWLYFYYVASLNPNYRKLNTQVREAGRARVAGMVQSGLHARSFRLPEQTTLSEVASEIQAIVTGAWVMGGTEDPRHRPEFYRGVERRILAIVGVSQKTGTPV